MKPELKGNLVRAALTGAVIAIAVAGISGGSALAADVADAGATSDFSLTQRVIQIFLTVTVLSLAPGLAMMMTSLPLIVIVMSIMRQGLGLQQAPPNMLIMGLSIFLTYFVMEPVAKDAWTEGVKPLLARQISEEDAARRALAPFEKFMEARVAPGTIETLAEARGVSLAGEKTPLAVLAPAFALSEIQRALQIGFVILLPFLIIDLIVASVLMSMGMMMVPPTIVSLPFKLAFFVLTNGWVAVSGALVRSYQ